MSKQNNDTEAETTSHELETLRNLIYGNQARAAEKRITHLERRVEAVYAELGETIRTKTGETGADSAAKLAKVRQELLERMDGQHADLGKRLDALAADMKNQINALQTKMEKLHAEQTERLLTLQADAQERDDDLRQELLTLTAWLDDQKTSRYTLGDLLVQLGDQLRQKKEEGNG